MFGFWWSLILFPICLSFPLSFFLFFGMFLLLPSQWKYFSNVWWSLMVGTEHRGTYKPFGCPVSLVGSLVSSDGEGCQLGHGSKHATLQLGHLEGLIRDHLWRCGQGAGETAKIISVCWGPKGRKRKSYLELHEGLHTGRAGVGAEVFSTRT